VEILAQKHVFETFNTIKVILFLYPEDQTRSMNLLHWNYQITADANQIESYTPIQVYIHQKKI